MGWFGDDSNQAQSYQQFQDTPPDNSASLSHEAISGAASYEAMKAYENHCDANGQPASHQEAKELAAGFAGAFIDREAETRGMDFIDREKAKRDAAQQVSDGIDQSGQFGGGDSGY